MKRKLIYIWLPLIIGASIAAGIFIGNKFTTNTSTVSLWSTSGNKIDQIIDYVNKAYVDTVNTNDLIERAIPTLIAGLDPHSTYMSSELMKIKGSELEGHFGGIGVEFIIYRDTVVVVNVMDGGPSEAAGLKSSDRIVFVDDSLFIGKDLNNNEVQKKLRGDKGTQLKLGIKQPGSDDIQSFIITRGDVPTKSVDISYMMEGNIGYIKVSKFASTTYDEFISAIAKLKSQGSKSFIIDLQQNSGGYMLAAIMMTNEFLSKGDLIVYTEGRTSAREDIYADNSGTCKTDPIVVLIDEGSASSSEIFAGAIQDNDRGLIVGRRSFGKGLVQSHHEFKDGSALRLTIARYHTPSGRCIQKDYEQGKGEEYHQDLINRYRRGEFDSRDSIKLDSLPLFYTSAGRVVYGNDGVLADVFVPRDTAGINSYYMKVVSSEALKEFTFNYTDNNRDMLKAMGSWEKAADYLSKQALVDDLVTYAATNKDIRRRPVLIEEARSILKTQTEALIIRNIFGEEGFFKLYDKDDKTIAKAIELIKNSMAKPKSIREEKYLVYDK